jgi:hypothetical protein
MDKVWPVVVKVVAFTALPLALILTVFALRRDDPERPVGVVLLVVGFVMATLVGLVVRRYGPPADPRERALVTLVPIVIAFVAARALGMI